MLKSSRRPADGFRKEAIMDDFNEWAQRQIEILETANEQSLARLMTVLVDVMGMTPRAAERWIAALDEETFG